MGVSDRHRPAWAFWEADISCFFVWFFRVNCNFSVVICSRVICLRLVVNYIKLHFRIVWNMVSISLLFILSHVSILDSRGRRFLWDQSGWTLASWVWRGQLIIIVHGAHLNISVSSGLTSQTSFVVWYALNTTQLTTKDTNAYPSHQQKPPKYHFLLIWWNHQNSFNSIFFFFMLGFVSHLLSVCFGR